MTSRILDFSLSPVRLRICNDSLEVTPENAPRQSIALRDIDSVVLGHPRITLTQAVLGRLGAAGVSVVCCDQNRKPAGILVPVSGNQAQRDRFDAQVALSAPRRKQLWKEIVRAKILAQGRVLEEFTGEDGGLSTLAGRVLSGDRANREAMAARRYWPLLFPEDAYRRGDGEDRRNHLLDYGYAILRAAVTRGLCAAGLHPSFSLHHHSPHNPLPLADDLVEPFRPVIDRAVRLEVDRRLAAGQELTLDSEAKRALLGVFPARFRVDGESRTMLDMINRTCQLLAAAVVDRRIAFRPPLWKAELRKDVSRAVPDHVGVRSVRSSSHD